MTDYDPDVVAAFGGKVAPQAAPARQYDPDVIAAFGLDSSKSSAPAQPATPREYDPDVIAAFASQDKGAPPKEPPATWLGAAKGVGDVALSLGSGTLRGVTHAVNDLLPEWVGGEGSRAATEQDIAHDHILNYEPQTEEGKYLMGRMRALFSPVNKVAAAAHDAISETFGERAANVTGDVLTLAPFAGRLGKEAMELRAEKQAAIESGHPLTGAAEAEQSKLAQMKSDAEAKGYDLPEGGTQDRHTRASQTNTPLVNADMREELNLPKNAPLTPGMLEKGREKFGAPGFQNVQNLKEQIPLNRAALDEARTSNMNASPSERLPFPQGNTITGAEAVDFSKKARYLANQMEKNPANPFAKQDAQMYRDAAEAVENSVGDRLKATGRGQMAADWDKARVYYAKSYSVENALDGAGNVRAGDLKTQLFRKGVPLSGNLENIANLAAQYPEAFKTSRVTMPYPGPLKKAAAAGLRMGGAYIGGAVGGGVGAAALERAGEMAGNKLLGN